LFFQLCVVDHALHQVFQTEIWLPARLRQVDPALLFEIPFARLFCDGF
jgi:hypothetical protein